MKESLKYLGKAEGRQASDMAEMTERRIGLIELFVRARKALQVRENKWTDSTAYTAFFLLTSHKYLKASQFCSN